MSSYALSASVLCPSLVKTERKHARSHHRRKPQKRFPERQGRAFLQAQIESLGDHSCWTCDLGKNPLPMWDEEIGSDAAHWAPLNEVNDQLKAAEAIIVIAPEWHGMVPAALKNFSGLRRNRVAHKPALAVGVSVGPGAPTPSPNCGSAATRTIVCATCLSISLFAIA